MPGQGTWTYNPATGDLTFDPIPGFTTDPTLVTYVLTEVSTGLTGTTTINVDYTQVAPVAVIDNSLNNTVGTNVTLNILTNDTLSDGSQATPTNTTVTLTTTGLPAGSTIAGNVLTVPGEGTWTYNPATGDLTFDPLPGFTTDPTDITYVLTEVSTSLTDTATVNIEYLAIKANDNSYTTLPGQTTISVLNNDTLFGQPVTLATVTINPEGTLPTGITLNSDGTVSIAQGTPAGTYTFNYIICSVANPLLCSTATVTIIVNPYTADLEVQNAVTPGIDGDNDVFKIIGIENYPNNTVEIFNRWGVLVYEASGYNNKSVSFAGESNGRVTVEQYNQLPTGTYFYILKYNKKLDGSGEAKDQAGYLYINR